MTIFTKYTKAKLKLLKAVFTYVQPYSSFEAYCSVLDDFKLKSNLDKLGIPQVLHTIISEYAHEDFKVEEVKENYDLLEKKFLEYAEPLYDHLLPAAASALLRKGFDDIEFLKDDFSIDPNYHCYLIKRLGVNFIEVLSDKGANFEKLQPGNIRVLVSELGIAAIKPLHEVGAKFEKLSSNDLFYLIASNPGIASIKPLSDAGAKFSDMDLKTKNLVVKTLGNEAMRVLSEVGVEFPGHKVVLQVESSEVSILDEHAPELTHYNQLSEAISLA